MARWEKWENGEVERWKVPGFIQGGRHKMIQDFIFLFLMLIKGTKGWDGFKIFLDGRRDGKTLLRSFASC